VPSGGKTLRDGPPGSVRNGGYLDPALAGRRISVGTMFLDGIGNVLERVPVEPVKLARRRRGGKDA
jgi:hypothetical protein